MTHDKVAHCDCGYEASGSEEAALVREIRRHALTAHGIAFSLEDALLVVLRAQLEHEVADASRQSPGRSGGAMESSDRGGDRAHELPTEGER